MTNKEFLQQAFFLDRKIKAKERQLESLRAHAEYMSPRLGDKVQASPSSRSYLEDTTIRIIELEDWIKAQIQELVRMKKEISEAIRSVGNIEYETVLEMRYLSFMSWEEITARMNYGSNYVFQIHRRALNLVHIPEDKA